MSAIALAYVPKLGAQTDTNDLIAAHLAGDERAFTRLVTQYQPRLVNFVTRMIQDRDRAEDLAQEAFLRVYRHLHRFDQSRKFSTWVYTIAANLARNELRNRKRSPLVLYQSLEPPIPQVRRWNSRIPTAGRTPSMTSAGSANWWTPRWIGSASRTAPSS